MTNQDDRNTNDTDYMHETDTDKYYVEPIENSAEEEQAATSEENENDLLVSSTSNPNPEPTKQNRFAMFLSSLAGGVTVAILGFILLFTGIIPIDSDQTMDTASTTDSVETTTVIQTSTDGDTVSADGLSNVSEAVVGVSNIQTTEAELWAESSESDTTGTGSGVIYKNEDGLAYIVTNHHVVDGATELEVTLANGDVLTATLLGSDELTDLAVLTIDGSEIDTIATLGSSSNLIVGETAIAIGNPLGTDFAGSVTKGIISGLERSVEVDLNSDGVADWTTEVIQTDAAINPGNSGGALVNSAGEVVGINSMKIALEEVEGIGFAIPIDDAKPIIEQLETEGSVSRPFIGINAIALSTVPERQIQQTLQLGTDVTEGVVIAEVQTDSAADIAGLERYDVITEINGTAITSMMDLKEYLYSETAIGDEIPITFYRNGEKQETNLTLTEQQENLTE
ncbi:MULTISPECIES: S1C family serine protease [Paraliobacillus]|uniref:S1C family serine protease n=1 Tax=Paraliobacillus TaxID=200903 RepID=UPI001E3E2199|nr:MULTISPECIES: trypsin-like peptidase domain-containing protein [Paraliobacillus]